MNKTIAFILFSLVSVNITSGVAGELDLKKLNPKVWLAASTEQPPKDFEVEKGVAIEGKTGEEIKTYMLKQAQKLKSVKGATVSTIRNGEVLKVSLPSSLLFVPNDTVLINNVETNLGPILTFMRRNLTKLLIVGHSDDTGSKKYTKIMAAKRAEIVETWFQNQGISEKDMIVYSFGEEKPLFNNDSMENRAKNRRVTFYFVPNADMIKQAKKKRLNK